MKIKTHAKLNTNSTSWHGLNYTDNFKFTGKIKYIKYHNCVKIEFEVTYFRKDYVTPKNWLYNLYYSILVYPTELAKITEFIDSSLFMIESQPDITIMECNND